MLIRVFSACLAGLVLDACDDNGKDQSKQSEASICKGLSEADCAAKSECEWNAEKDKCKRKKVKDEAPEAASPEQAPPSEPAPEPDPTPEAPEQTPAPEAPETPEPETTPPQ